MKLLYYPETDSLYVELTDAAGVNTIEVGNGVIADLNGDGRVVGFDIDDASSRVDLRTLEISRLPLLKSQAG